jgi:ubiquinone biosynthesis protein UbiJ
MLSDLLADVLTRVGCQVMQPSQAYLQTIGRWEQGHAVIELKDMSLMLYCVLTPKGPFYLTEPSGSRVAQMTATLPSFLVQLDWTTPGPNKEIQLSGDMNFWLVLKQYYADQQLDLANLLSPIVGDVAAQAASQAAGKVGEMHQAEKERLQVALKAWVARHPDHWVTAGEIKEFNDRVDRLCCQIDALATAIARRQSR